MATAAPGPWPYRPRQPERTVLYRALAHHFERFLQVYEERFEPTHGYLRRSVESAVYRYLDCGIFAHGVARAHCAECGHHLLIAFSCKLRCLCPSCHQKRELLWAEGAGDLLAEVPHRQVVFTVPKRLRIFFRFDRKLLGELPGCAWRALKVYLAAWFGRDDAEPGAIGFLQTAGELLGWHPHLHVLLTDGAWLPDGTFRHLLAFD
ncbi:MAG: transposase zinc-binding domain-containing protein, partial [Thermoanaerobaculia bacterium]